MAPKNEQSKAKVSEKVSEETPRELEDNSQAETAAGPSTGTYTHAHASTSTTSLAAITASSSNSSQNRLVGDNPFDPDSEMSSRMSQRYGRGNPGNGRHVVIPRNEGRGPSKHILRSEWVRSRVIIVIEQLCVLGYHGEGFDPATQWVSADFWNQLNTMIDQVFEEFCGNTQGDMSAMVRGATVKAVKTEDHFSLQCIPFGFQRGMDGWTMDLAQQPHSPGLLQHIQTHHMNPTTGTAGYTTHTPNPFHAGGGGQAIVGAAYHHPTAAQQAAAQVAAFQNAHQNVYTVPQALYGASQPGVYQPGVAPQNPFQGAVQSVYGSAGGAAGAGNGGTGATPPGFGAN